LNQKLKKAIIICMSKLEQKPAQKSGIRLMQSREATGNKIIAKALTEFKAELRRIYGQRLKQVILYGSYARGSARADSDLDLAVVLKGKVKPGKEIDRMLDAVVEMNLNYQVLISVYPVSEQDFLFRKSPLLMNIHKEGARI